MKTFEVSPLEASTISRRQKQFTLQDEFQYYRARTASSILEFNFMKKRVRILSEAGEVTDDSQGIVYWMLRDARVQDNWALLFAQKLALKNQNPLHVCYCLVPDYLDITNRHCKFILGGLQEVSEDCKKLNITFHLLRGEPSHVLPQFIRMHDIGGVVCDFNPLRVPTKWVKELKESLPEDVPLCQVDAHNIIPVWVASTQLEFSARTFRSKVSRLVEWLTEFPPIIEHPYKFEGVREVIDWRDIIDSLKVDQTINEVQWAKPGYKEGVLMLDSFLERRLKNYNEKRGNPTLNGLSNLSPWHNFGHISIQRTLLAVKKFKLLYKKAVEAFTEEALVRRELAENFCYYNKNYDNFHGCPEWAQKTLNKHRYDKRRHFYTLKTLEQAKTHDVLWNSAQLQMVKKGKMHGYLRTYWAKKILEWTKSPEDALKISMYLNDRYSLDGKDPGGYVGCMFSIGGVHDHSWRERKIYGKIRYMTYDQCERKFDIKSYIAYHGGKEYHKRPKISPSDVQRMDEK